MTKNVKEHIKLNKKKIILKIFLIKKDEILNKKI